jgi:hypothetical protein
MSSTKAMDAVKAASLAAAKATVGSATLASK